MRGAARQSHSPAAEDLDLPEQVYDVSRSLSFAKPQSCTCARLCLLRRFSAGSLCLGQSVAAVTVARSAHLVRGYSSPGSGNDDRVSVKLLL